VVTNEPILPTATATTMKHLISQMQQLNLSRGILTDNATDSGSTFTACTYAAIRHA